MKKKSLLAFCALIIFFCSCSDEANPESEVMLSETPSSAVSDSSSTTAEPSTVTTEATTTIYEPDAIDEIISYIKTNNINAGAFYDFDKDGYPELIEFLGGTYNDKYSYDIYNLKGESPHFIGELAVDASQKTNNMFSLYKDSTGELFYFGEWRTIFFGTSQNSEVSMLIIRFKNDAIEQTCIGFYTYKYDQSSEKIWLDGQFMGNKIEPGYYDKTVTFYNLLGVDNYLSQFEKIEEPNLQPQWYSYDDTDLEINVREALSGYDLQ